MKTHRILALGSLPVAALLALAGAAGAQQGVKLKTLKPDEFKQIHGTTDRYELMSMELKGDCTQCHERRNETEIKAAAGVLLRQESGGAETLRPYDKLESHPVGEFDLFHRDPDWGTVNFLGEYLGGKYHSLDGEVRYQSVLDATVFSHVYPHNAEHLVLPPATPEVPTPLYNPDDQSPGDDYRKELSEQGAALRVGPQSYPAHLRLNARRYEVKGHVQQQFLDEGGTTGAAKCTNCHNVSQNRDLDNTTASLQAGADAHVGYANVAYTFDYLEFRDDENDPVHNFGEVPGVDPGGVSAHNTYPDMTQMDHTVTANTMSSGVVAAWAAFNLGGRENEDTGLGEAYYKGLADATWRPLEWLSVAARYRRSHREDDASETIKNLRTSAGQPAEYAQTVNRYTGTLILQPFNSLNLRGDFTRREEIREEAQAFGEPTDTRSNQWAASVTYHPARHVTLRARFEDMRTDDAPALRTSPSDSTRFLAWANVQAARWLLLFGEWSFADTENRFADSEKDQNLLQAGITIAPPGSPFTVGAYYSGFRTEATTAESASDTFLLVDEDLSYDATGSQILLQATWRASERLSLKAEAGFLKAEGTMDSSPANLARWSDFDATQTNVSLDAEYEFPSGWGLGGRAAWAKYEQDETTSAPDPDEKLWEGQLTLSKRW